VAEGSLLTTIDVDAHDAINVKRVCSSGGKGDDGGGVTTGDDGGAYAEAGEYAHDFLEVALGQPLGGAFREVEDNDDNGKDDGDE
jgi:hypothetical protein